MSHTIGKAREIDVVIVPKSIVNIEMEGEIEKKGERTE